jgi:hypothetical protein
MADTVPQPTPPNPVSPNQPTQTPPPAITTPAPANQKPASQPSSGALPPRMMAIRTYRSDVAGEITEKGISQTDIALAEEKRARELGRPLSEARLPVEKSRTWLFASLGVVFVALIGGFIGYSYLGTTKNITVQTPTGPEALIFAEKKQKVDLSAVTSRLDAIGTLRTIISKARDPQNTLEYLYFTTKNGTTDAIIPAETFLSTLAPTAPNALVRSLTPDFMYGLYTSGETKNAFLLLKPASYETAYSGMLAWEGKIDADLLPLFGILDLVDKKNESWKDDTLQNIDIRREVDQNGNTVILYSFLDKNTILITPSDTVFYEVLGRLHTPKPVTQ